MKRPFALALALSTLVLIALPAGAAPAKKATFAVEGEARGLELALGDQGLTLGVALTRGNSSPFAAGAGAGQCTVLGSNNDPAEIPCNESTMQKSSTATGGNTPGETCAAPSIPAPLNSVLNIDLACGSSSSSIVKGLPVSSNTGKIGEATLDLDLRGLIPQAEDAKEQLVDQLQDILGGAPEPIATAVNQLLDVVDDGQALQILLGPATSDITAKGDTITVTSASAGARIGVAGIPDLDNEGEPILGTSEATEDGLVIIEIGDAFAKASVDKVSAAAKSDASAALVTVKVRDITQVQPTYQEVSVAPGQTVTILEGTPAESTISAAAATTDEKPGSALAAADAVRLHLLKGVSGGIKLGLARATAAATAEAPPLAAVEEPPLAKVLPQTGARDVTFVALGLLLLAAIGLVVRRRFS